MALQRLALAASLAGTAALACAANPDVGVALALTPTLRPRSQTQAGAAQGAASQAQRVQVIKAVRAASRGWMAMVRPFPEAVHTAGVLRARLAAPRCVS